MKIQSYVHDKVSFIAPINGISFKNPTDKSTWKINFASSATDQQKANAQAYLNNLSIDDIKSDIKDKEKDITKKGIDKRIIAAFDQIMDYLREGGITTDTNNQFIQKIKNRIV